MSDDTQKGEQTTAVAEPTSPRGFMQEVVDSWKNHDESPSVAAPEAHEEKPAARSGGKDKQPAESESRGKNETSSDSEVEETGDDFDADLLAHAKDLGFSEKEARSLGTPEALRNSLSILDREMTRRRDAHRARQQQQSQQQRAPEPKQGETSPAATENPAGSEKKTGKFELKLDPQLVDPEVIASFEGMRDHYEDRIGKLEQQISQMVPAVERVYMEAQAANVREFDTAIGKLGPRFVEVLGDGATTEMDQESDAWKARDRIYRRANRLAEDYQAEGIRVPKLPELIRRAAYVEFPDQAKKQAKDEALEELEEQQSSQASSRPTHRNGRKTEVQPDDDPYTAAEKVFKKHGIPFTPRRESSEASSLGW